MAIHGIDIIGHNILIYIFSFACHAFFTYIYCFEFIYDSKILERSVSARPFMFGPFLTAQVVLRVLPYFDVSAACDRSFVRD